MNEKKALEIIESLVIASMQSGMFKDFQTLDTCREAVAFLKAQHALKQVEANGIDKRAKENVT